MKTFKWSRNQVLWDDDSGRAIAKTCGPTKKCREARAEVLAQALNAWLRGDDLKAEAQALYLGILKRSTNDG